MAADLIIAPEAERDLAEAYAWYEERQIGRGEDFLRRVDACVQAICRAPELHASSSEGFRRGLVRRFPYAVIYDYTADTVAIYGVFHCSSDPRGWKRRLL